MNEFKINRWLKTFAKALPKLSMVILILGSQCASAMVIFSETLGTPNWVEWYRRLTPQKQDQYENYLAEQGELTDSLTEQLRYLREKYRLEGEKKARESFERTESLLGLETIGKILSGHHLFNYYYDKNVADDTKAEDFIALTNQISKVFDQANLDVRKFVFGPEFTILSVFWHFAFPEDVKDKKTEGILIGLAKQRDEVKLQIFTQGERYGNFRKLIQKAIPPLIPKFSYREGLEFLEVPIYLPRLISGNYTENGYPVRPQKNKELNVEQLAARFVNLSKQLRARGFTHQTPISQNAELSPIDQCGRSLKN